MRSCLAVLVLAGALSSQTYVRPAHFERAEGPAAASAVVGETQAFGRLLQIHDDLRGPAGSIKSLGFRLDDATSAPAFSILVDVWCSTARASAAQPDPLFDADHGPDKTQTTRLELVQFPAASRRIPVTDGFTHVIPFDAPFVFAGAGSLAWEIVLHGTSLLNPVSFDAIAGLAGNPPVPQLPVGDGCYTSGTGFSSRFTLSSSNTADWPQGIFTLNLNAAAGPHSQLAALVVGTRFDTFAGLKLPYLIPGSPNAASHACSLLTEAAVMVPTLMKSDGSLSLPFQSPLGRFLHGYDLGFQILARDPGANPADLVASDAIAFRFVAPFGPQPVGQVSLTGSQGPVGTAKANTGLITRIEY